MKERKLNKKLNENTCENVHAFKWKVKENINDVNCANTPGRLKIKRRGAA